ncbi:MAG: adenosylcobalamin-dependent ribonucleoside-diphosphate reductase [Nitrososphaeria archaeon]
MSKVKKVIKRDGRIVDFDASRIENAVKKAMNSVGKYNKESLKKVVQHVLKVIDEKFGESETYPHVEEIQDIVELALVKYGLYEVAKAYILYRRERENIRKEKMILLEKDYVDEVDKKLSLNAIRLIASRYLLRNEEGKLIEDPKGMFKRVAALVVIPDILYDEEVFSKKETMHPHPFEQFDFKEWCNRVGLGKNSNGFAFTWNKHHLERMKALYDELNNAGKMKVPWNKFWNMLLEGKFEKYYKNFQEYYNLMVEKRFLPNSPTLFNAGARLSQLSACFVLDVEDSIDSIMDTAKDAALIFKSGGGVGINFSKLRPEGDTVFSTGGVASGPTSFMQIIDKVTDVIKQGGKRRGANMGILEIWHPDIEKFITSKGEEGKLVNYNLSVLITPDFWKHYEEGKPYPLRNPRDGKVWKEINPKSLFHQIAQMAWRTGDPGVIFLDHINRRNILKKALGEIRTTNPCGEEPLYPYESCNLGSINVYAFVKEDSTFDWDGFRKTVATALRFLDNIIDVNKYPTKKIEEHTKRSRKVGLGFMGLGDALFALKIPYNSEEGFSFIRTLTENLTYYAMEASIERAKERGVFPLYYNSAYVDGEMPFEGFYRREIWTLDWNKIAEEIKVHGIRNAEVTTVAPTGSISMIFDVSSGIEPQFALVYEKRVTVGKFFYVDIEFERALKERGLYDEKILKKVADNGGSLQGLEEIPEDMKKIFLVAYDIPWWDHIRAQSEAQTWICASISKTVNMPKWVTVEDVEKAYLFSYKIGLKSLTIYRDTSKSVQVLVTPSQRQGTYAAITENKTIEIMKNLGIDVTNILGKKTVEETIKTYSLTEELSALTAEEPSRNKKKLETCQDCGSRNLIFQDDCIKCLDCGWVACPTS